MIEDVITYLQNRQWEFQQLDDNTIATGFSSPLPNGADHGFPLFFMVIEDRLQDSYLRLTIVPYVDKPEGGFTGLMTEFICNMNHNIPLAKLAIDEEGDLEFMIDIPKAELTAQKINLSIQLLADYASMYLSDLVQENQ